MTPTACKLPTVGSKYQRLAGIKTRYDPDNAFRMNANIKPAPQLRHPPGRIEPE